MALPLAVKIGLGLFAAGVSVVALRKPSKKKPKIFAVPLAPDEEPWTPWFGLLPAGCPEPRVIPIPGTPGPSGFFVVPDSGRAVPMLGTTPPGSCTIPFLPGSPLTRKEDIPNYVRAAWGWQVPWPVSLSGMTVGEALKQGVQLAPPPVTGVIDNAGNWGEKANPYSWDILGRYYVPMGTNPFDTIFDSWFWDLAVVASAFIPGVGPAVSLGLVVLVNVGRGAAVDDAVLQAARTQVPAGADRAAFDAGVAVAQSGNIREAENARAFVERDLGPEAAGYFDQGVAVGAEAQKRAGN